MHHPFQQTAFHRGFLLWVALFLFGLGNVARAYLVGPPLSLEQLTEEADIVFKAKAVSTAPVEDAWFKPVVGFEARETQFKLISVVKGGHAGDVLQFRHYDEKGSESVRMYQPQFYHFEAGKTCLVFAKKSDTPGVFRQISPHHTGKEDQGVLRCANEKPAAAAKVKDVMWAEIQAMLGSSVSKDLIYGIQQLRDMGALPSQFATTTDFDRIEALKAIAPFMVAEDGEVARAAITVIGSKNPYMADDHAQFWLATVGSAEIPGVGQTDAKMKNVGGELFWKELIAVADGKAAVETRALAIRSLGLVRKAELVPAIEKWLAAPEPTVRAAAVVLLADYPASDTAKRFPAFAGDAAPEVRRCAAHAIGFLQKVEMAGTLATLLKDKDKQVRFAASQSLLSFSPDKQPIAKIFQDNIGNEEFSPLFLNALAKGKPGEYLDQLAKTIVERTEPKNWQGGQVPAFTAWNILFKYLQKQSAGEMRSGKFDRYLDAMEKGYAGSSSEPRDIYAFYLQRGMDQRAKQYREAAKKAVTYDLDYYFNQVDQNPAQYTR